MERLRGFSSGWDTYRTLAGLLTSVLVYICAKPRCLNGQEDVSEEQTKDGVHFSWEKEEEHDVEPDAAEHL